MKYYIFKSGWAYIVALFLIVACNKSSSDSDTIVPPPPPPPQATKLLLNLPAGWKYSAGLSSAFAEGMQVFIYDSIWQGSKLKVVCAAWDTKAGKIEMKPVLSNTGKKPSTFFAEETGSVLACINGGYFGGNQSFSTVKYNGQVLSANIKLLQRLYNGANTAYFPTRAAFGIEYDGSASAGWIYHEGVTHEIIYRYPIPSANAEGLEPQPIPDAQFPVGGSIWNAQSAIGGSPMLVFNNEIKITDKEELISINNNSARPRSGIGYNANGIAMLIAVEGDNALGGYAGINLAQFAALLRQMGISHAVNLDGGGSSSLIVNNQLTIRPGDNGIERPVISAIVLKRK